jgi:Tol biopolymer transport system component
VHDRCALGNVLSALGGDRSASILVVSSNGAGARQIVSSPSADVLITLPIGWASDNNLIGYLRLPQGNSDNRAELHVLNLTSGEDAVVYQVPGPVCCSSIGSATWSPNGGWLAFGMQNPDAESGVFLIRPDGSGLRKVSSLSISVMTWLPGG